MTFADGSSTHGDCQIVKNCYQDLEKIILCMGCTENLIDYPSFCLLTRIKCLCVDVGFLLIQYTSNCDIRPHSVCQRYPKCNIGLSKVSAILPFISFQVYLGDE